MYHSFLTGTSIVQDLSFGAIFKRKNSKIEIKNSNSLILKTAVENFVMTVCLVCLYVPRPLFTSFVFCAWQQHEQANTKNLPTHTNKGSCMDSHTKTRLLSHGDPSSRSPALNPTILVAGVVARRASSYTIKGKTARHLKAANFPIIIVLFTEVEHKSEPKEAGAGIRGGLFRSSRTGHFAPSPCSSARPRPAPSACSRSKPRGRQRRVAPFQELPAQHDTARTAATTTTFAHARRRIHHSNRLIADTQRLHAETLKFVIFFVQQGDRSNITVCGQQQQQASAKEPACVCHARVRGQPANDHPSERRP